MATTEKVQKIHVAAGQIVSTPGDIAGNLAQVAELTRTAAKAGVRLILFAEGALTGYLLTPEILPQALTAGRPRGAEAAGDREEERYRRGRRDAGAGREEAAHERLRGLPGREAAGAAQAQADAHGAERGADARPGEADGVRGGRREVCHLHLRGLGDPGYPEQAGGLGRAGVAQPDGGRRRAQVHEARRRTWRTPRGSRPT